MISGLFCILRPPTTELFYITATGKTKTRERVLSRESSFCPALDRYTFQLHRHPRFRLPLPERPVCDDRPRGRGPSAAARLQHGERQSRGGTRILLDQGRRRAADLEAAEDQGRRRNPGRPQGHW